MTLYKLQKSQKWINAVIASLQFPHIRSPNKRRDMKGVIFVLDDGTFFKVLRSVSDVINLTESKSTIAGHKKTQKPKIIKNN